MRQKLFLLLVITTITFAPMTSCKKTTDDRADFVSFYAVTETWPENGKMLTKSVFFMPVYKSSISSNGLLLENFANYGNGIVVEAIVSGNIITIPRQVLPNSRTIVGTGSIDNNGTLTFTYTEIYGIFSNSVSATAQKK